MFKSKMEIGVKLVETIMPFRDIDGFEIYLEPKVKYYDGESVMITEVDVFIETDRKNSYF